MGYEPAAVCDRCGGDKGLHAVGESCNQNCGGKVIVNPRASTSVGYEPGEAVIQDAEFVIRSLAKGDTISADWIEQTLASLVALRASALPPREAGEAEARVRDQRDAALALLSDAVRLRQELENRRACILGAQQTVEMAVATLENADDIGLARAALLAPLRERADLLQQALDSTDAALRSEAHPREGSER